MVRLPTAKQQDKTGVYVYACVCVHILCVYVCVCACVVCICVYVCVGSCQLPPCGEPGNTLSV